MSGPGPEEPRASRSVLGAVRAHPVVTAVMVLCTLTGALLGPELLTEEWSLARSVLAGTLAGARTGLLLPATKMLG
ncbi:MAG: hypothetical protein R3263_00265 [Myxococcota bacterium]|nr:hypothetical protein [Myxococcota bacterium]